MPQYSEPLSATQQCLMGPIFSMQGVSDVAKLPLQIISYYYIDIYCCLCTFNSSNCGCKHTHNLYVYNSFLYIEILLLYPLRTR